MFFLCYEKRGLHISEKTNNIGHHPTEHITGHLKQKRHERKEMCKRRTNVWKLACQVSPALIVIDL